jgi:hypothetical protein
MKALIALTGGLAGACIVTAMHQLIKKEDFKHAPRMDLLGMESLIKLAEKAHVKVPTGERLYNVTLAGDILSNTLYYSGIGIGKKQTWLKGGVLGLVAGLGAVYLPKPLHLNEAHSNRTPKTQVLSVLYYLTGGVVAAGVMQLLNNRQNA